MQIFYRSSFKYCPSQLLNIHQMHSVFYPYIKIRLPSLLLNAKQIVKMRTVSSRNQSSVPKGHIAVYVGDLERKRFVVPISYFNHPSFSALLKSAEEEFGFRHPIGGLTIPCREDVFIDLTSRLHTS